jgi:hypothetical protein
MSGGGGDLQKATNEYPFQQTKCLEGRDKTTSELSPIEEEGGLVGGMPPNPVDYSGTP